MDDNSKKLIEDCFLRPIAESRSTNVQPETQSKPNLKAELQQLYLSDESQKMIMETLRSIHGADFQLDEKSNYKDKGGRLKNSYWEDRGQLIVQGISNYSAPDNTANATEDRFRKYARMKLESYGFAEKHCNQALDYCKGQVESALELLFCKYMKYSPETKSNGDYSETDLAEMVEDEKMALESIYDKAFEEKEKNRFWLLKFQIDHLLSYSPSHKRKVKEQETKCETIKQKKKPQCRNFLKGHCSFGNKCRFSHEIEAKETNEDSASDSNDERNWFYLEIKFPKDTCYPFEPPYLFLKTSCPDIPGHVLLQISRKLFKDSIDMAKDGMPSIFTLSEFLQMEEEVANFLKQDQEDFLDPDKSLFYEEDEQEQLQNAPEDLPSHYKLGSVGNPDRQRSNPQQILRENQQLVRELLEKKKQAYFKNMIKVRQKLPAWGKMEEILDTITNSQVVVISGETGCGKSTQVPQFILDQWLFKSSQLENLDDMEHCEIICTQPRRLSAIGVSERVADERNERVGKSVGYQIRLENKISSSTRLTFCTTGILLRRLHSDPLLKSVTHIIVDEVHERSEESDFLLLILKGLLKKRNDLKVILMSATLNAKLFSDYFNGAPVLDIPGRTFPVEQLFLEDILESTDYVLEMDSKYCRKMRKKDEEDLLNELENIDIKADFDPPPRSIKDESLNLSALFARYSAYTRKTCKSLFLMDTMKINPELIEAVLLYIIDGDHDWPRTGSILIFLPGIGEIQAVYDALCENSIFNPRSGKFILVPLHSTLTSEEQSLVFKKTPEGKRKIVLSTNIAETSITIEDCVFVIDSGLMKEKRFDANKNMESLELVWGSRANAMQRKGRAGRVMPGVCIHLFTSHRFHNHILSQPVPEIHRVPLEPVILRIKTLTSFKDRDIHNVLNDTLEPPSEDSIESAIKRLQDVGAFDEQRNLTVLGHHLSALPVDVRIGKLMLFGAIFQCVDSVLTMAACLSHKSPFVTPFSKRYEADKKKKDFAIYNSDHLTVLMAYKKWLEALKKSSYAGRCFADENFLSVKTLETIGDIKYQFLELLVSIGFVPIDLPQRRKNATDNILEMTGHDLNANGTNYRLLISMLCAALYPNIVKVLTPEKSFTMVAGGAVPSVVQPKDLRFKTREDGFVTIHPSSVISNIGNFLSPFLIFQEKIKTSKIFIRECSMVPLVPLVFFAGSDLRIELHSGDFLILLDKGWIILKARTHETAEMIQCLRKELLNILEEKIRDPCLNLHNHENGKKIISTIVYLVTRD